MEDFIKTFTLILISCFIVNLFGALYPETKSKHTYLVVLSVVIVWLCISPISNLLSLFEDISDYEPKEGVDYEFVSSVYDDILESETYYTD